MTEPNEPATAVWHVPSCGVSRTLLMYGNGEASAHGFTVESVAREIVGHFEEQQEAAADLAAVLAAKRPTNRLLHQVYRHAFHPLYLVTIGEALACPAGSRRLQIEAAFVPVFGAAGRVKPPGPRRRSVNPETKDFRKFTSGVGRDLAWRAAWAWDHTRFDVEAELSKEADLCSEHREAVLKAAVAEARRQLDNSRKELEKRIAALALLEQVAAGHVCGAAKAA